MDTKDTVETTVLGTTPAKRAPHVPKEHPEEGAAGEPVREPKLEPMVPLNGTGVQDKSLDRGGLGASFEGLSVTTVEGKDKRNAQEGGYHEGAHDLKRGIAFAAKPSHSPTVHEATGPTAHSAMHTAGFPTHPTIDVLTWGALGRRVTLARMRKRKQSIGRSGHPHRTTRSRILATLQTETKVCTTRAYVHIDTWVRQLIGLRAPYGKRHSIRAHNPTSGPTPLVARR